MPVINFNGIGKIMYANSEISKVYCGSQLVWEAIVATVNILIRGERKYNDVAKVHYYPWRVNPQRGKTYQVVLNQYNGSRYTIAGVMLADGRKLRLKNTDGESLNANRILAGQGYVSGDLLEGSIGITFGMDKVDIEVLASGAGLEKPEEPDKGYVITTTTDSLRPMETYLYLKRADGLNESLRIYKIEIDGETITGDFKAESAYGDYVINLKRNGFSKIVYSGTSVKLYYR